MTPKLDIIVPHWTEKWEVGEKLFRMIGLQRGADLNAIRVTIVNDGGKRVPEKCLKGLRYPVRQIDIPHSGVSAARNAGIDAAEADWVMFCDFDDVFANLYALRDVLMVLTPEAREKFDMLWTEMITEDLQNDLVYFAPDKQKWVFTHGKVYNRAFLNAQGLRFNTELQFNEDSEFNARIIARTPHTRIGEIQCRSPMYIWIRRPSSVTQSGREDEAAYGHFRRNMTVTAENLEHRGLTEFCGMVTRSAWDAWFMCQGRRVSREMKLKIAAEFAPWIAERKDAFLQVDDDTLAQLRQVSRGELTDPGEIIPDDPPVVAEWVKQLIERGGKHGNINN